jgi:cyclic-di-GMP-binding protein
MPSFDAVSRVEMQEVDNAINNTLKEIATRYDFRGLHTEIVFDKKEKKINVVAADQMKMDAIKEMFLAKAAKRNLEIKTFEFKDAEPTAKAALKRVIVVKEGIPQELAKKLVKQIKDTKIKVQASIQGEELRVTGKNRDDLQAVMQLLRTETEVPLQFVNFKD